MSCYKVRYPTRLRALIVLAKIRRQSDSSDGKLPCRAYPCPDCKGWHLTSLGGRGSRNTLEAR